MTIEEARGVLSPAAQAVLRTAADQFPWDEGFNGMCCCEHLKAIAAELEGNQ